MMTNTEHAAALEQLKADIVAMSKAEERIQYLEAILYSIRGCAGMCQNCKNLIEKIDAQGRPTPKGDSR